MKKRIFAFLTALVLCLVLLPVVQRADAAFVDDLQFEPYVYDPTGKVQTDTIVSGPSWCAIEALDWDSFVLHLFGKETLPVGVDPSGISVTRLQWSPGTTFDPANAHDFTFDYGNYYANWVRWKNEEARLAEVHIRNNVGKVVPDMEAAGLSNLDPFTVRATQRWSGGEYTFDFTFPALINLRAGGGAS